MWATLALSAPDTKMASQGGLEYPVLYIFYVSMEMKLQEEVYSQNGILKLLVAHHYRHTHAQTDKVDIVDY